MILFSYLAIAGMCCAAAVFAYHVIWMVVDHYNNHFTSKYYSNKINHDLIKLNNTMFK